MPRKRIPIYPGVPYHINARCQNREWFTLDMPSVWRLMQDYLHLVAIGFKLHIYSFVLMNNHYHMIASAPDGNLSDALEYLQRETSREMGRLTGRINHMWGGRNHKTFIGPYHYYMNTYKYVYRNPVRAGLCARVEDYPYSTLHGLTGRSQLVVPMVEDTILFSPGSELNALDWLNTMSAPELEEELRRALRRPIFTLAARGPGRKPSRLETDLI